MKKRLLFPLLLLFLLCACGGEQGGSAPYTTADLQALLDAGAFSGEMEEVDGDTAALLYGLDLDQVAECACYMAINTSVSADEAAVLVMTDEAAAEAAVAACEKRVERQIESCEDYCPDQVPRLEDAVISRRENTVLFAVGDPEALPQALQDLALD